MMTLDELKEIIYQILPEAMFRENPTGEIVIQTGLVENYDTGLLEDFE